MNKTGEDVTALRKNNEKLPCNLSWFLLFFVPQEEKEEYSRVRPSWECSKLSQ